MHCPTCFKHNVRLAHCQKVILRADDRISIRIRPAHERCAFLLGHRQKVAASRRQNSNLFSVHDQTMRLPLPYRRKSQISDRPLLNDRSILRLRLFSCKPSFENIIFTFRLRQRKRGRFNRVRCRIVGRIDSLGKFIRNRIINERKLCIECHILCRRHVYCRHCIAVLIPPCNKLIPFLDRLGQRDLFTSNCVFRRRQTKPVCLISDRIFDQTVMRRNRYLFRRIEILFKQLVTAIPSRKTISFFGRRRGRQREDFTLLNCKNHVGLIVCRMLAVGDRHTIDFRLCFFPRLPSRRRLRLPNRADDHIRHYNIAAPRCADIALSVHKPAAEFPAFGRLCRRRQDDGRLRLH